MFLATSVKKHGWLADQVLGRYSPVRQYIPQFRIERRIWHTAVLDWLWYWREKPSFQASLSANPNRQRTCCGLAFRTWPQSSRSLSRLYCWEIPRPYNSVGTLCKMLRGTINWPPIWTSKSKAHRPELVLTEIPGGAFLRIALRQSVIIVLEPIGQQATIPYSKNPTGTIPISYHPQAISPISHYRHRLSIDVR